MGVPVIIMWPRGSSPHLLPSPPLTAWLQRTAVTRIHLCHHPTVGLMSSPVKPLEHSTWASPTSPRPPRSKALGLPQRVPSPSLNHRMSGKSCPTGSRVCTSWPLRGPKRPTQITLQRKRSGVDVGLGRTGLGRPPFSPICSEEFPSPLC